MVGKKLFFNLLWRIGLLIVTSLAIHFMVTRMLDREAVFTLVVGVTFLLVQIYFLSAYVLRINKTLISFIDTVGQSSATELQFHDRNPGLSSLESRLNQLKSEVSSSRLEEQKQKSLLHHVIGAMDTGIICINQKQEVVFSNKSASAMLNNNAYSSMDEMEKNHPLLASALKNSKSGVSKIIPMTEFKASVRCNDFVIDTQHYSLFSIQNIQREVDAQETESWQKLIRVLTHEIMNSIGPILSLSQSLRKSVDQKDKLVSGLSTIENTGEGLIHFIKEYRKLSTLPPPDKKTFTIADLFGQIQSLFSEECSKNHIQFTVLPENTRLQLLADQHQVELILINLVKNAIDSLKTSPNGILTIRALHTSDKIQIQVEDNGPGIHEDMKEQIFVPFFTTKNNGTGIGLSLSRQIMNNHDGSIQFSSIPDKKTVFTLSF